MTYIFANKTYLCHKYFNEAVHLLSALFMQTGSVWGFLPRNRFKDTISFSGTGMFYDGIFFQNLFLFRNYILFRNCFCQTNPFQELFLSNQSFSGTVFVKQVLFRNGFLKNCPLTCLLNRKTNDPDKIRSFIPGFFRNCHVWHCLVPSPSHTILFQELSCLTLPFSKPIAYRPLSGTVISDTACFKAGQFLIQCKKMLLRKMENSSSLYLKITVCNYS